MSQFLPRPSVPRVLTGALRNLCPRCRKAKIYKGILRMAPRCPACDYVFERENGYFIGSATLGYLIGAISVVPTMVYGMLGLDYPVPWVVAAAGLQLCLLCPLLIRISRLLWIHFDYDADH